MPALLGYLCARGSSAGALFRFGDGKVLFRPRFVERVRAALRLAGVDQAKYCSHSFRIWGCHYAGGKRSERLRDQHFGPMGECSISPLHQNTS